MHPTTGRSFIPKPPSLQPTPKQFMNKVIALFNQSGGVGKSTLTMNVGYHLSQRQQSVLLIDMDPQGSLTTFMGVDTVALSQTIYDSILDSQPLAIHSQIHAVDLVPANLNLSAAEMELVVAEMREVRLRDALEPVRNRYNFILVDCPPSLGVLSYISLVAATDILIPIETQYKAFCGTELLLNTIARIRSRANPQLRIAGFVPTRYDGRNSQDSRTFEAIETQLSPLGQVYPPIPRSTAFADATENNLPLAIYSPRHPALAVLDEIACDLESL